ncbi:hypothetical protein K2P97_04015 [bacterium]|nr:hypothetical protein [bacterium]
MKKLELEDDLLQLEFNARLNRSGIKLKVEIEQFWGYKFYMRIIYVVQSSSEALSLD